jgi:polar amino acid transport system substrate-binding protein
MRLFPASSYVALALVVVSCAQPAAAPATQSAPPPSAAKAAPPADIVRAGTITIGVNTNNLVIVSGKDASTGAPQGVGPDVANELAARLGVKVTWSESTDNAKALANLKSGTWDIITISSELVGPDDGDFISYLEVDHTLLVPAGSTIKSLADADRAGVRISVQKGGGPEQTLSRAVKAATIVPHDPRTPAAIVEALKQGGWDAYAGTRQAALNFAAQLPGSRVLDDRFGSALQGFAVKKGRADLFAYLRDFIADAKSSGLVKRSLDKWNVRGVQVTP